MIIKQIIMAPKEIKIILKNLGSDAPKSKSDKRNKKTASIKKEKYAIATNPKITDTQKGR